MVKFVLKSLLIIGILTRIYLQFVTPCFNDDEIALGENIKTRDFMSLLYPLDNFQSAPPLFLFTQKIFFSIPIGSFWVNTKLLSFFVSIGIITLVYRLTVILFEKEIYAILLLALFCFNPFIIYNTLTLKQYGIDLLFLLFLYFQFRKSNQPSAVYFILWSLFSNIGLFFTVGYLTILFTDIIKKHVKPSYLITQFFTLRNILLTLGPLIYILYFSWYMNQNGASETKEFMQVFWAQSFIPLNTSVVKYLITFSQGVILYFISSFKILALPLSAILLFGIFHTLKIRQFHLSNKFLIAGTSIHVLLNILHLYPLGDRLYLYLALPLYLLLIKGCNIIDEKISWNWLKKIFYGLITSIVLTYFTYLPYRENDINSLFNYLSQKSSKKVTYSSRSLSQIKDFRKFTEGSFTKQYDDRSTELSRGDLYVSRVHHKFGHKEKTSREEIQTLKLIESGKLKIIHRVDGFNIYEIR